MKVFKFYVIAFRERPFYEWQSLDPPWELVHDRFSGFSLYPTLEDAELYLQMLADRSGQQLLPQGRHVYHFQTDPFHEYKIFQCDQSDLFMKEKDKSPWAVGALRKKIDPQELARKQLEKNLLDNEKKS